MKELEDITYSELKLLPIKEFVPLYENDLNKIYDVKLNTLFR